MGQDPSASAPCWLNWKVTQSHSKHVLQSTMECSTASRIKHRREGAINKKGQEVKKRNKWQQDLALVIALSPMSSARTLSSCAAHVTLLQLSLFHSRHLSPYRQQAARGTAWLGAPCLQRELVLAPGTCSLSLCGAGS